MIAESERSTDSIPHPFSQAAAQPVPGPGITEAAEPYLAYLSELADRLGLIDPVETYFRPLTAHWSELTAEAERLRGAAGVAAEVSARLDDHLGRLDGSWEGRDADAFVGYIREIGAAGGDLQEALNVLAGALDEVVTTVRHIVVDLVEVLVDTAELTSESMTLPSGGTKRARAQLQEAQNSAKSMYEVARDVLEAFQRLCDGVDGPDLASRSIEIKHRYPQEKFKLHDVPGAPAATDAAAPPPEVAAGSPDGATAPSPDGAVGLSPEVAAAGSPDGATVPSSADSSGDATTPSAADASEHRHTGSGDPSTVQQPADPAPQAPAPAQENHGSSGMPMVPMGMLGGFAMGGGGGARRQPKTRPVTKPTELLGEPGMVAPPVIGEEEPPPSKPADQPPAAPPAKPPAS